MFRFDTKSNDVKKMKNENCLWFSVSILLLCVYVCRCLGVCDEANSSNKCKRFIENFIICFLCDARYFSWRMAITFEGVSAQNDIEHPPTSTFRYSNSQNPDDSC